MNLDTQLRKLPHNYKKTLCDFLNYHGDWKKVFGIIPKKLLRNTYKCEVSPDNPYKYNVHHIKLIEEEVLNVRSGSCAEIFLRIWGTTGPVLPTLGHFLDLLTRAELFVAADYIRVDVLGLEPAPRPDTGPAAAVKIDLPRKQKIEDVLDGMEYPSQISNLNQVTSHDLNVNIKSKMVIPKIVFNLDMDNNPVEPSDMMKFSKLELQSEPETHGKTDPHVEQSDMIKFSQTEVSVQNSPIPNISDLIGPDSQNSDSQNNLSTVSTSSPAIEMLLNGNGTTTQNIEESDDVSTISNGLPNLSILNESNTCDVLPSLDALISKSSKKIPVESDENIPNFNVIMLSTPSVERSNSSGSGSGSSLKTSLGSIGVSAGSYMPQSQRSTQTKCGSPLPNLSLNTILPHFTYEEIEAATKNFDNTSYKNCKEVENDLDASNGRFLGSGGFGSVYLGLGLTDKPVAVKKLFLNNPDVVNLDDRVSIQFKKEVEILCKYKHENLLSLLGYSCDGLTYCLLYEFVPGGSLADRLRNAENKLIWTDRLYIALGTARAAAYLHTAYSTPLIHMDIKTANILLDCSNKPKLCDFGLVKLLPNQTDNALTTIFGTAYYMAPEAFRDVISDKLDTFSFGVVLLELITGLPPLDNDREGGDIVTYVKEYLEDGIASSVDTNAGTWISNNTNYSEELYKVAITCIEDNWKQRPTMEEVLENLKQLIEDSV